MDRAPEAAREALGAEVALCQSAAVFRAGPGGWEERGGNRPRCVQEAQVRPELECRGHGRPAQGSLNF